MKLLALPLKNLDGKGGEPCFLDEAIQKQRLVVLLGPPGSGKTSILEKYNNENSNDSEFITVRNFLKPRTKLAKNTKVLLLDGLDEFRSISNNEKISVVMDLAEKINDLKIDKIVLSCREMDWYGEVDVASLGENIRESASIYQILPLSEQLQMDFARLHKIKDEEFFINKFSSYGFLENPQLFGMTAEIFKHSPDTDFKSKKELFREFFLTIKEENV